MYLIKEAAQLSGVSVKTLHHYDKIGLLIPQKGDNGYRYYDEAELERLQVILFYKYLGFSLAEIAELLNEKKSDLLSHLSRQLNLLQKEKDHLEILIDTLQKTIQAQKGNVTMTTKEKFTGFTYDNHTGYYDQAVQKYGKEVMDRARQKQVGKEEEMMTAFNQVFASFAQHLTDNMDVIDAVNQALADQLYHLINEYAFDCSIEVFGYIGKSYAANPDFKHNIDQFGTGVADYASHVIEAYVASHR